VVTVPICARALSERTIVPRFALLLAESGLPPGSLRVEVSEEDLTSDPTSTISLVGQMVDEGIGVTVGDYGIGQLPVRLLHAMPVDELRLDGAFIRSRHEDDAPFIRALVDLAHDLGKVVRAPEVADQETLAELWRLGCDRASGSVIGMPTTPEAFAARLTRST
jgi:EAL domain-containing protein (putative c-di-GMP-specific phosphodiesterase class I)